MRSLAVVFIASVIWTITADAQQRVFTCCTAVSTVEFIDPVIGVRLQKQNLSCVKAVIFETERGEFCCDPKQPWVQKKVMQFIRAQRNKRPSSTPPPASPTSEHTHVGGSTQSSTLINHKHKISTDAPQEVMLTSLCCKAVSNASLPDPITGYRKQKRNPPCVKAVIFETERGEFCCDWTQRWVQKKVKHFVRTQRCIYRRYARDVTVDRLRLRPLCGKRLSGSIGFQREWREIHTKHIQKRKRAL